MNQNGAGLSALRAGHMDSDYALPKDTHVREWLVSKCDECRCLCTYDALPNLNSLGRHFSWHPGIIHLVFKEMISFTIHERILINN